MMLLTRIASVGAAMLVSITLAGCGGGGGGTGTATASTPAPTVAGGGAAAPANISITPAYAILGTSSTERWYERSDPDVGGVSLTISNPNGGSHALGALATSGASITVTVSGEAGMAYNRTFAAGTMTAGTFVTPARTFRASSWGAAFPGGDQISVHRLLEGGGKEADYAAIGELRTVSVSSPSGNGVNRYNGFTVIGTPTDASAMPKTGTATFTGTAVGRHYAMGGLQSEPNANFSASVSLTANFAATGAGGISGRMDQFSSDSISIPGLYLLSGTITGNRFTGGMSVNQSRGAIAGQFYGSGADAAAEVGGVFMAESTARLGGWLVGGFVAGR